MSIKIGRIKLLTTDKAIPILIVFSIAYYPISYTLNQLVNKYIQYGAWWDSAICLGLYLMAILLSLPEIVKRQTYKSIGIFAFCFIVYGITILLGLTGSEIAEEKVVMVFTRCVPFVFVGCAIVDFEDLDKKLEFGTRIIVIAAVIWIFIVVFDLYRNIRTPYMQISYYVLPSSLLRIYYYFRERNTKNLIYFLIGIMCHIIWGTRGPILFIFLFVALCLIYSSKSNKRFFIAILLAATGIFLYSKMYDILFLANNVFTKYGLKNGGIIKMLSEDMSDGRVDLVSQLMPYIKQNIVLGGGIYSDRVYIGNYTHLLPLELICDFGLIIGPVIFLTITITLIKRLIHIKYYTDFRWAILWVAILVGYGKLFLSSSYLEDPFFFFLLGLLTNKTITEGTINREIYDA